MKTLFVAYRVTDLDRSLGFCTTLGYVEPGRVDVGDGSPDQLKTRSVGITGFEPVTSRL